MPKAWEVIVGWIKCIHISFVQRASTLSHIVLLLKVLLAVIQKSFEC